MVLLTCLDQDGNNFQSLTMWDGIEQWSLSNAVHIIDIGSKFETKSDNVNPVPLGSRPCTAGLVQNRNLDRIFIYPSPNKKHIFLERVTSLLVNFLSKWYLASLSLPRRDAIDFRSCNSMAAWTGNLFDSMYWGCRPLILSVLSRSLSGHHMYSMYHKVVSGLGFESFVVTPLAAGACHDVES